MSINDLIETRLALLSLAHRLGDEDWADELKVALTNLVDTREYIEQKKRDFETYGE